jgi:hypothetical protein
MSRGGIMRDKNEKDTGILGLGGSVVPKSPGDPTASDDPESVHQRKHRIANAEAEDFATHHEDSGSQHAGATGIDMGSGGEGTNLSGK